MGHMLEGIGGVRGSDPWFCTAGVGPPVSGKVGVGAAKRWEERAWRGRG